MKELKQSGLWVLLHVVLFGCGFQGPKLDPGWEAFRGAVNGGRVSHHAPERLRIEYEPGLLEQNYDSRAILEEYVTAAKRHGAEERRRLDNDHVVVLELNDRVLELQRFHGRGRASIELRWVDPKAG